MQNGQTSLFKINTNASTKKLAVKGISYNYDQSQRLASACITEPTALTAAAKYTSYNLFNQNQNWLRLFNPASSQITAQVKIKTPQGQVVTKTYKINAHAGISLGLHNYTAYSTAANSSNIVRVYEAVIGEILRLRTLSFGDVDYALSTPIGYL
ncbi:MAG: hypothetical protein IT292_06250 [Deltaproteobacteria bacterium]|nr:hypothetical protein [Deltaproteobacteria bacterium]